MKSKHLLANSPEEYKKIGILFSQLNFVEIQVITFLTMFFGNQGKKETKDTVLNDALFDNDIFERFENKMNLVKRIISTLDRVSKGKGGAFDKNKYLKICEKIKGVQTVRNQLAHHHLGIRVDGKGVGFLKRKSDKERIDEITRGVKAGTTKQVLIDLDEELIKSDEMCDAVVGLFGLNKEAMDLGVL